ncbi:MAG TPA: hypothetical protein VLI06_00770 [Solimonas sp.]|nr:hypothetical protein [Solimonas sp.]
MAGATEDAMGFRQAGTWVMLAGALALAGCGGGGGGGSGSNSGGAQARSMEEHFSRNVQPSVDFCRTCHVPGAAADVEDGRDFQLSSNKSQDLANLKASWERLGGNNPTSRILLMASGQETPHSGGAPWAKNGPAYRNMEILLQCFGDPAACAALLGGGLDVGTLLPLLETDPAASWSLNERFCEGQQQPDSAVIPEDPRHLVLPGVSEGRAVAFNEYWEDCHQNIEVKRAQTCGEYRDRKRRGREQAVQSPVDGLFGEANTLFHIGRAGFDDLWKTWGLPGRPTDFDERLIQRYGLARADFRNPYPLPTEDPEATDGGSGQLPIGLVQMKDAQGHYTGKVSMTCATCHSASLGEPADGEGLGGIIGMAANVDFDVLLVDFLSSNVGVPSAVIPLPVDLSARRGALNAAGFSAIALAIADLDVLRLTSPVPRFNLLIPSTGNTKTVSWWHTLHRMRSFFDGVHGIDNHRMNSVAFGGVSQITGPLLGKPFDLIGNEEKYVETVSEFMNSMRPPKFPRPVDTAQAEQGAILFHSKDLWAGGELGDLPKPESNGSCAGCHGVYSPRYANDPAYLKDPRLKGVTGYLAPMEIIATDPARAANFPAEVRYGLTSSWIGYPEGVPGWIDPKDKNPLQETLDDYQPMDQRPQGVCTWHQEVGYNTPSLYGVWANAPYLHNGSVPSIWQLLKPEERPALWRRQLTPGTAQERGYDTSLGAYDFDAMGWKHEVLSCGMSDLSCSQQAAPLLNIPANLPTAGVGGSGLLGLIPADRSTIERRKAYNSYQFAAGNQGHDYGKALTDAERRALIEYLKTL